MENKKTAVFGIYSTVPAADAATDTIVRTGFLPANLSALMPENPGSRPIVTQTASKAPEGAAAGAGSSVGRFGQGPCGKFLIASFAPAHFAGSF